MTPRISPRPGSRAYVALARLYSIGGQASPEVWERSCRLPEDFPFPSQVMAPLREQGLVQVDEQLCFLTQAGREHLGVAHVDVPPPLLQVAGPKYEPPQRPLAPRSIRLQLPIRPGAFEYRDIPSRVGSAHVPFKSQSGGDTE